MKKLITVILALTLGLSLSACSEKKSEADPENIPKSDEGEANYAIIKVKDFGEITVELRPDLAPKTTEMFVNNVRDGFYTGKNFHRIIADFMIQGGSADGRGGVNFEAETLHIEAHPDARHYYGALCLANYQGYGSESFYIVNNKDPEAFSKTLQLYKSELDDVTANKDTYIQMYGEEVINAHIADMEEKVAAFEAAPDEVKQKYAEVGGTPQLDGGYTIFGYMIDGAEVLDEISAAEVVDNGAGEISKPTKDIIIEWIVVKSELN